MYSNILKDGDALVKLDPRYKIDVEDYVNMREQHLSAMVKWLHIRSFVVTKHGRTIWQLMVDYLDSQNSRAIGIIEPPLHLIKWIIGKA